MQTIFPFDLAELQEKYTQNVSIQIKWEVTIAVATEEYGSIFACPSFRLIFALALESLSIGVQGNYTTAVLIESLHLSNRSKYMYLSLHLPYSTAVYMLRITKMKTTRAIRYYQLEISG